MKNHLGKRIISVLLSALMVITMIPTFAITAFAGDASGAQSDFLTSESTMNNGVTANKTLTWDSSKNGVYFDGSTSVTIASTPLKNVTQSSGFIISMDVYNTDSALANKYLHFTNGSQRFSVEGSSPDWWTRYRTEISNGSNTRGYYTSDFTSGDYCNPTGSANGNDSYPTNEWYTLTLVMNTDGSYSYYRNGDLLATFKSNYISTGNGGGLTDESAASVVAGLTNYYIGASNGSGADGFTGYIRNVKFYDNAQNINIQIARYEAKMSCGKIFKNLSAGYSAYLDAKTVLDSYTYGDSSAGKATASDLNTKASALSTAIGNMTEWTRQGTSNTTKHGVFAGDTRSGAETYPNNGDYEFALHNLLYVQTGIAKGSSGRKAFSGDGDYNIRKELYYPDATMLYVDENSKPTIPVIVRVYCDGKTGLFDSNKTRYALSAYQNLESDKWSLTKKNGGYYKWFGGYDNLDFAWTIYYGESDGKMLNAVNSSTGYSTGHAFQTRNNKTNYSGLFSNYITYNATMSDSVAYDTITPSFWVYCGSNSSWTANDGLSTEIKGGTDIHIINYCRLIHKINSYSGSAYGINIANYTQNRANGNNKTVANFFTAFDAMTSFDLNSYFTSSNNWNGCQSAMTTAINGMNNQSVTADEDGYAALRAAITYEGVIENLGDGLTRSVREMAATPDGADTYRNFNAFVAAYNAATGHMAALNGGAYSSDTTAADLADALIAAFNDLGIKGAEEPTITGNTFIGKNETVTITNNDTNGAVLHYSIAYDGEETPSVDTTINTTSADISVFANSDEHGTALVKAWAAVPNSDLISSVVTLNCVNRDYAADTLVYQESFDGARIDGTDFLTGSTKGVNGTLANSGSAAVEASAGADYDKRANVLKINAATLNTRGNYIQMSKNPLASSINAAYTKDRGVTVSFWRKHTAENSGRWLNALSFTSYDSSHEENRYKYATLTSTGCLTFVQRDNEGGSASGGGYMDYFPNECDITNHSASANEGYWENIVLTVDAKKTNLTEAFTIYINGEPHDVSSTDVTNIVARTKGAGFAEMSDSEIIAAFLEFITDGDTHFDFAYAGYGDSDIDKDMWLDDIRIYTKPLTQVEINNMYTDEFTDAKKAGINYQSSTSHDPTNVTVYTLENAVTTDNGTKAAGSKVGQEFIDYYNVPASNYTVEYYSFGTGLTVYHSYDNLNWTCIGDSQGRFGYQNEELFVSASGVAQPYYTTLADTLAWAAQDTTSDDRAGAAGKLVWAPHVMYNLITDQWMYYGSTSSWNSAYSTVFLLTSDFVDHGYKYQQTIVKTQPGQNTNAIDSCVYYGHDSNGRIDKSQLYCLYGSWSDIRIKTLNANGTRSDGEADLGNTILSVAHGGGEGGYMIYKDGYYYYFITPEANGWAQSGGNYHVRVFRSENPTSGFVSVAGTAANTTADPHGNAMLTAYDNSTVDYKYTSTGHTSFYKAVNGYNEEVYINAAHTREYSHDSKPVEDGALATRQISLVGNVAIQNPVAFTTDGWPVAFPKIYDNTFSLHNKGANSAQRNYFTAYDIDGVYASNQTTTNGVVSNEEIYKIFAINSTSGVIVDENTITTHNFTLEHTNDCTYIHLVNNDGTHFAEGVIANQGENGSAVPMFSFLIESGTSSAYHVWGVKTAENPTTEEIQEDIERPVSEYTSVNGKAYYQGNEATNGYNKVAYCTTTTVTGGQVDKFYELMNMHLPTKVVLVYDGDDNNRPSLPAVFSNKSNGTGQEQHVAYVASTTSNLAFKQNWIGNTTNTTEWPGNALQTATFGYDSDHQLENDGALNDNTNTRYWWNKLYYTGSGNTSTYYDVITNPTFHTRGKYKSTYEEADIPAPASTIYVLNYKPILDILNGNTKLTGTNLSYLDVYDDVKANKYTPASTMQFYRAMELVMGVNPSNEKYDYASDTVGAINQFVADMNQALAVFGIVTLDERADLTKLDNAFNSADSILKDLNGKVAKYDKASVTALVNAVTDSDVQTYVNADQETRDGYGQAVETNADTKADAIIAAIDGLKIAQSIASEETVQAYETAVDTINNLDPDAYDAANESISTATSTANTVVGDTSVSYGDATINVVDGTATDQNVQDATSAILSGLSSSVKRYTIKTYGVDETGFNNGTFSGDDGTYTATYGTTVTCVSNIGDTAWFLGVKTNTTEKKSSYYGYGKRLQIKVMGDTEIKADKDNDENFEVKIIKDYSNDDTARVQYIDYVASGYEFEIPAAPAYAYYTFAGYEVDGVSKIAGDKITISKDTVIYAKYTVNSDADCAINTNVGNVSAKYNSKVTIHGNDTTVGWVEEIGTNKYRPFYEGKDVTFFASESTNLMAVNSLDGYHFDTPAINLRKSGTIKSGTRTVFNAQLIDGGKEIEEYGILIGTGDIDREDLVVEKSGNQGTYRVVRAKSTKLIGEANQFTIAINNLPDNYIYKGYVIYEDGSYEFVTNYSETIEV